MKANLLQGVIQRVFQALCFLVMAVGGQVWASADHEAHQAKAAVAPRAPGYGPLGFELPPVGSYERPVIGRAADAEVIDSFGRKTTLHQLMQGKVTLLSFMYTSCSDVNGCPLASYVLHRVMQRLANDERLQTKVQLLSLSFDRINDTPEVLARYSDRFEASDTKHWQFLTTPSDQALAQVLKDYNQFIIQDVDSEGKIIGSISHLLRVYLIDDAKNLREVYSVSFLHADILVQDMLTIMSDAT